MHHKIIIDYKRPLKISLNSDIEFSNDYEVSILKCFVDKNKIVVLTYESLEKAMSFKKESEIIFFEIKRNVVINGMILQLKEWQYYDKATNSSRTEIKVNLPGLSKSGTHYVAAENVNLGLNFSFLSIGQYNFYNLNFYYNYLLKDIVIENQVSNCNSVINSSSEFISICYENPSQFLFFILYGIQTFRLEKRGEFNYEPYSFDRLMSHYQDIKVSLNL